MKRNKPAWRYLLPALAAVAGGVAGYLYYRFVGCVSGTCAIAADPLVSTLYGAVLGLLLGIAAAPSGPKGAGESGAGDPRA